MIIGPNIIRDGLVFGYDADERSTRFYKGEPTTNLLKKTTDFSTGWSRLNVTTVLQTNVKNPFGLNENVYLWSTSNSTNHQLFYYGIGTTEQRVFSCYAKKTLHKGFYLAIYNDGYVVYFDLEAKKITSTVGTGVQGYIDILDNDWCRCSIYAPKATVEVHIGFLDNTYTGTFSSPWAISTTIGTEGLIFGHQFEFNTHPTTYLPNPTTSTLSRTTTQSLIDLKRNTTIDVSNISFDWKGDPYFYKSGNNIISINTYPIVYTNFSVEAWIFLNGFDSGINVGQVIAEQYSANSGWIFSLVGSSAYLELRNHNNGVGAYNLIYGTSLNIGKWYHVAASDDGTTVRLFINGNVVASTNSSTTTGAISTPMRIGSFDTGYGVFSGKIKSLKLYNNALTPSEVLQNYNASKGRFEEENRLNEGLVLHLDANNKNSYPGTGTAWYDLAGSNYGTLVNGPTFSNIGDGSLLFDGVDDYGMLTNTISLGSGNVAWTVNTWIKTTTTVDYLVAGTILSNLESGPVYSSMCVNSGKITYWTYQYNSWAQKKGTITINDGKWHQLTWVNYSNYTMDLYVDGVLDTHVADSTSGHNNPVNGIAKAWSTSTFDGSISNIRVYQNRALTNQEVSDLYNRDKKRFGL